MDDTLSDANLDEQALKNQLMEMELSSATNSSSPQNVSNGISVRFQRTFSGIH